MRLFRMRMTDKVIIMQDRYAGDVGDFGKLGLLRELERAGFTVGVNWYKALPPSELDQNGNYKTKDGKYKIKTEYFPCDEPLAKILLEISEGNGSRSIEKLERAGLLKHAVYFGKTVSATERKEWHKEALETLADCDLVFLDPDNGLRVCSVGEHSGKSVKYVFDDELADYLCRAQSVVLYNHRPRKNFEKYLDEYRERFSGIEGAKGKRITVMTFHKGTTRDYFLIAANDAHARIIEDVTEQMIKSGWGGSQKLFTKCLL